VEINQQPHTADLLQCLWIKNADNRFPPDDDLPLTDDIVVLKLRDTIGKAAKLRARRKVEAGLFSAFGTTNSHPGGVESKFTVGRVDTRGVAQLVWDKNGVPVERGFSGSPVYDNQDFVVGIIVSRWLPDEKDTFSGPLAYMIPVETVAATVKNVEQGFELEVKSALYVDYPSVKELFEWSWGRLRRRTVRAAKSRDLLELNLLVSKAQAEEQRAALSAIEQLHSGSLDFSAFDHLSSSDLLENERQFLYLRAAGGSGKSFYLYRLIIAAVHSDVVPFFIDVRNLSNYSPGEISAKLGCSLVDALDNFINDCGVHSGAEKFHAADQRQSLLLIDGLNETTLGFEQIVRILQAIPNNYDHVSLIAADRLAPRPEYPRGFRFATMEPVSDELIADALKRHAISAVVPRILKLPFFLDLYLQDPKTLAEGKRGALVLEFVRRSLIGHDLGSDQTAAESQVNAISDAAFRWYEKYKSTVISSSQLQMLLPDDNVSLETLVSSGLLVRRIGTDSESPVEFQHQLIHDYLAARHFVGVPLAWSANNFKILTLNRQSADVLVFAREMIEDAKGASAADDFITQVYDWDYPSALSCLQLTDERSAARPIGIVISALVAEKAFERFLHSRQSAETQLPNIKRGLLLQSELPDTIKELTQYVAGLKLGAHDELFERWRTLYVKTGSIDDDGVLESLISDNPLMGWTAANVIRRLELTKVGIAALKMALAITGKKLSRANPTPVRWRIYHALGTHFSTDAFEMLWRGSWNPSEHEDTSYGAARSLVELALYAPDEKNRVEILNRISKQMNELTRSIGTAEAKDVAESVRGLGAFRKCAILKAKKSDEPPSWIESYLPILDSGIELFQKLGEDAR